jgi:hypothetical protein
LPRIPIADPAHLFLGLVRDDRPSCRAWRVALLGAGLAPAGAGSRIDAVVVGDRDRASAPRSPPRVVRDLGLGHRFLVATSDSAAPFLRAGVLAAVHVAPLVVAGAAGWVLILRRISPPLPEPPPDPPSVRQDPDLVAEPHPPRPLDVGQHPESACLPSRSPRYEMIVRKRVQVALARVGMLRRDRAAGVGFGHPRIASPIAIRCPIQCPPRAAARRRRSMSIRNRRAIDRVNAGMAASSRRDPSEMMLAGLPDRVPPGGRSG